MQAEHSSKNLEQTFTAWCKNASNQPKLKSACGTVITLI
jgi:hypothetical protein